MQSDMFGVNFQPHNSVFLLAKGLNISVLKYVEEVKMLKCVDFYYRRQNEDEHIEMNNATKSEKSTSSEESSEQSDEPEKHPPKSSSPIMRQKCEDENKNTLKNNKPKLSLQFDENFESFLREEEVEDEENNMLQKPQDTRFLKNKRNVAPHHYEDHHHPNIDLPLANGNSHTITPSLANRQTYTVNFSASSQNTTLLQEGRKKVIIHKK